MLGGFPVTRWAASLSLAGAPLLTCALRNTFPIWAVDPGLAVDY
jgi:hypothetical protein